jgi:hypothetical protein
MGDRVRIHRCMYKSRLDRSSKWMVFTSTSLLINSSPNHPKSIHSRKLFEFVWLRASLCEVPKKLMEQNLGKRFPFGPLTCTYPSSVVEKCRCWRMETRRSTVAEIDVLETYPQVFFSSTISIRTRRKATTAKTNFPWPLRQHPINAQPRWSSHPYAPAQLRRPWFQPTPPLMCSTE